MASIINHLAKFEIGAIDVLAIRFSVIYISVIVFTLIRITL